MNENNIPFDSFVTLIGGARGVNSFAESYSCINKLDMVVLQPNRNKYGKSAGYRRNKDIEKLRDTILAIVEKSTRGTWDTTKKAKRNGKIVCLC